VQYGGKSSNRIFLDHYASISHHNAFYEAYKSVGNIKIKFNTSVNTIQQMAPYTAT